MITFRDATIHDAADLETLLAEYYVYEGTDPSFLEGYLGTNGRAILCYDDTNLIAASLWSVGTSLSRRCKKLEIDLIYVTPDSRGLGIGKELMQRTANKAYGESCDMLLWGWSSEDSAACRFFLTAGARYTGGAVFAVPGEDIVNFASSVCLCGSDDCSGDCASCKGC